jgi:hypothetical protein
MLPLTSGSFGAAHLMTLKRADIGTGRASMHRDAFYACLEA